MGNMYVESSALILAARPTRQAEIPGISGIRTTIYSMPTMAGLSDRDKND
jgi:hypothetical protein